ncbi:MAG: methyltransferase domain-containing protein, partial [Pseudomonadota bacterium]
MVRSCPACGEADFEATARFDRVPVQVNRLARTREEALASPCGPIDLVRCRHCGTSWNHRFDPALVHYDAGYDNPLDVSPVFRDWQTGAARDLVARHQLHGATVLEVGCGRAGFLRAVLAAGAGRGLAYEPAWDPAWPVPPGCEIRSSAFQSVGADDRRADLVILRHVLEHLEEPLALLQLLRQLGCPILVEVPDGATLMEPGGCWDLIYEHVSYFEASGMSRLLERAGFAVDRIGREFGDQFLVVDAR